MFTISNFGTRINETLMKKMSERPQLTVIEGGSSDTDDFADSTRAALVRLTRALGVERSTPETCLSDIRELCLAKLKILAVEYPQYGKFLERFQEIRSDIARQSNQGLGELIFDQQFKEIIEGFFNSRRDILNLLKTPAQTKDYVLGEILSTALQGDDSLIARFQSGSAKHS